MPGGRPPKFQRTEFGQRLVELRQERGLSQNQVAEKLELSQQTYAGWERSTTALRPTELVRLAEIFKISTDELLGNAPMKKRSNGPAGRARRLFEEVTELPRSQQSKILDTVETLIAGQAARKKAS